MANKFTNIMSAFGDGLKKHSPEIRTGIGVGLLLTSVVLTASATVKAVDILAEEEEKKGAALTVKEKAKTVWKPYILPAMAAVTGSLCVFSGQKESLRRTSSAIAAAKLTEVAYKEYKDTVIEELGEKKEKIIREKVAEKRASENPVNQETIVITGEGNYLCMDSLTGTYFMSNQNRVMAAVNDLNTRLNNGCEGMITLNEYLLELGCRAIDIGNDLVWDTGNKIDVTYTTVMSNEDNPRPCMVLSHYNMPNGRYSSVGDLGRYY